MHKIQQALYKLTESKNLGAMTLRDIGALIGEASPQKIKHHLGALEKKGLIRIDKGGEKIERVKAGKVGGAASLLSIPLLGTANCGPATFYADNNTEGYLKVSAGLLKKKKDVYAIRADGISMNNAQVAGKTIDDGDYLIVDSARKTPENGDVVVSVFDDVANVKKYIWDSENGCVVLVSDSTKHFPPIYIHESDDFQIAGTVIQVIKKPQY